MAVNDRCATLRSMNEADQLAAAIEVVQAVYGPERIAQHVAEVMSVLEAIRANQADELTSSRGATRSRRASAAGSG